MLPVSARENKPIRLLYLDDHALVRASVGSLLEREPDLQLVGSCGTVAEGLRIIAANEIDIVLLDLNLRGEHGMEFLEGSMAQGFKGRVLVVAANVSDAEVVRLAASGVAGILLKDAAPELLPKWIRKVAAGELCFDQDQLRCILRATAGYLKNTAEAEAFNVREKQVLRYLLQGQVNKEIAASMGIPETSVKAILHRLFEKTGVRTRSQLVRIAIERYRDELNI